MRPLIIRSPLHRSRSRSVSPRASVARGSSTPDTSLPLTPAPHGVKPRSRWPRPARRCTVVVRTCPSGPGHAVPQGARALKSAAEPASTTTPRPQLVLEAPPGSRHSGHARRTRSPMTLDITPCPACSAEPLTSSAGGSGERQVCSSGAVRGRACLSAIRGGRPSRSGARSRSCRWAGQPRSPRRSRPHPHRRRRLRRSC